MALLELHSIIKQLKAKNIQLEIFQELASTNSYVKKFFGQSKIHVCLAESQTAGRGRFNRQWHSPFGQNIYLSMLYPFQKKMISLSGLSLVIAVSICQLLEERFGIHHKIDVKWPNDIMCHGKKLAGILIEAQATMPGCCDVIIGVGLNINMTENNKMTIPWTSLKKETGKDYDRNIIVASLIDKLCDDMHAFNHKGLQPFLSEFQKRDVLKGNIIQIKSNENEIQGICHGINEQGELMLELSNGEIKAFFSGDVSIKSHNQ